MKMVHIVRSLAILVVFAQTSRPQEPQCMQGFLGESTLRSKAALIGRTVARQQEQVIVPGMKFTCTGTLTGWRFVAQRISGRGRTDYPELQVWRPQSTSPGVYDIVRSVSVSPQSTGQSKVYTHTLTSSISYQAGDILGLYHPQTDSSAYKILSVQHGGPSNYYTQRQDRSSEMFNTQSSSVRVHRDYPLVGAITNHPECLMGFLSESDLNARGRSLGGESRYQALSDQQRLALSLTYGCHGKIGRIVVAGQNRGTGGGRNRYPEIHMMRLSSPGYYLRYATFQLNQLTDLQSPNVLEFSPTSMPSIQPGDVIRLYQPQSSQSVFEVYHEPGVGPLNYYINGMSIETTSVFPVNSVSMRDNSQPLFIVELVAKCPSLQSPGNGRVDVMGSVAVYGCASGYWLNGQRERLCDNNTARWMGRDPQCTIVDCGSLPQVANGQVTLLSGTGLGAVASYSCGAQYLLDGSSTRRCLATNQWSGQPPSCRRLCSTLTGVANGQVSASSQPVEGDSASFSCYLHYELVGSASSTCQANGQWSPTLPYCKLIQCQELARPENGVVNYSPVDRRVGSTATFQCSTGYQLTGEASLLCQQNREWSFQLPTCQRIQCPSLSQPANGEMEVSGSEAVYTCNEGYRLVGFSTITCQTSGVWSHSPPTCEPVQCPVLFNPANGIVEFRSRYVGSSARYICFPGYRLVGVANMSCQLSTQDWSHSPPTCQLIDCGPPDIPQNGYVILRSERTYLDDYALYSCGSGYSLEGREQRVCQENGLWSGDLPGCLAVDCGTPQEVAHAEVRANGSRLHDVATYRCNAGYRMTGGDPQLVCQHEAEWEGAPPLCTVVTCGKLPPPANGRVSWESTVFNSTASYSCREEFELRGRASERVCLANGFWSGRPPLCAPIPTSTTANPDQTRPKPTTTTTSRGYDEPSDANDPPMSDKLTLTSPPQPPSFLSHQPTSSIPTVTTAPTSDNSGQRDTNAYIIWAMIALLICLIILVAMLIIVVYLRKHRTRKLDSTATNSVENPVYSGHGGTPLDTINCFRPASAAGPCSLSGLEMHGFSVQSVTESETEPKQGFEVSNGVHLYDFPSLTASRRSIDSYSGSQDGSNRGVVGHSYEFPDHYHLATQYEVPVASYEKPTSRARLHIYKNTLPPDIYVPTQEQREKGKERQVSCQSSSNLSPTAVDESMFFSETETYWRPASDPASLYEQLARNKYREIGRKHIQVTELLGAGQFGQVNRGTWQDPAGGETEVAIKTLKPGVTEEDKVRFLQEAAISGQFQHPNVVRLHGVVTVGEPIMIILELLPNGDLRDYLLKQRPGLGQILDNSWPKQLLHFCRDIASGMTYLSSKAFVHRDLAARNILVAQDHSCKIGDFGLSRDLDEENYYISNGGKIPVKWTAPEALHYKKYSTASDVWSFGCLMYEIWSLGHKPFEKNSNAEAIKMVDRGFRLPPPPGCPRAIYQLMIQCWHPRTSSRPAFPVLLHALSRDSRRLLSWSKGDVEAHSQAPVLAAPLEAGLDLYVDLQRTYLLASTTSP